MVVASLPMKVASDHLEDLGKDIELSEPSRNGFSRQAEEELAIFDRKMLLKLDVVLVPMMAMLYLLSFLDRSNLGNARVAGLQKDLGLTDHQYQTALTVTYVPYIASELPSNLLLKKIGPRIVLPFLCTVWGVVTTLQSQVHNYAGLLACRFFLGLMEGGLFPGIVLYLSGFYRRHELQVRVGLFFSAAALSGAFSGLLAAAIQQMDGIGNLRGWQWIFCLEGLFTVCFGVFSFFVLPNTPEQVRTFTPEQAAHCIERLKLDVAFPDTEKVTLSVVLSVFKSLHVWLQCISLFCSGCCLLGMAYFTPSIVQGLGYSATRTQLMTVPPFISGFIVTMIAAYLADRYRQRGLVALATWSISLVGIVIFYLGRGLALRYVSLFLLIIGFYATAPSLITWVPNNTAAHTRRATAIAFAFITTNVGGIVSTWIFPKSDAPYYPFAARFILSMTVLAMVLNAATLLVLRRLNDQKADPVWREKALSEVQGLSIPEQIEILGDAHPDFKYTY